jgi:hypothetical protein
MRRRLFVLLALGGALASLILAATAGADGLRGHFVTKLTGEAEAPVSGDPDGIGRAKILIQHQKGMLCWWINVRRIELPATAAHIHVAPVGTPGPIVVPLSAPDADGNSQGCTQVSSELLTAIATNPADYYVNVHNVPYPAGALRGQLG